MTTEANGVKVDTWNVGAYGRRTKVMQYDAESHENVQTFAFNWEEWDANDIQARWGDI